MDTNTSVSTAHSVPPSPTNKHPQNFIHNTNFHVSKGMSQYCFLWTILKPREFCWFSFRDLLNETITGAWKLADIMNEKQKKTRWQLGCECSTAGSWLRCISSQVNTTPAFSARWRHLTMFAFFSSLPRIPGFTVCWAVLDPLQEK